MTVEGIRVSPDWLALREPADGAARSRELAALLAARPVPAGGHVIHDLAGGTGSMGRWLAPLLPGPQRWVVHDRDADLLARAAADPPGRALDGAPVEVETRLGDISALPAAALADATLVTASALLDLLTAGELPGLVARCLAPGCPVLLALSVVGEVALDPADPLDASLATAFDAHQRRGTSGGPLLGPDAPRAAADAFRAAGAEVVVRPSPWLLGPEDGALAAAWLEGWAGAAVEQAPGLAPAAAPYLERRLAAADAGALRASVGHADLLVLPAGSGAG